MNSIDPDLFLLPYKAVHIQSLDAAGIPIEGAIASGFIVNEGKDRFLYTCWHVVTGFDPFDIRIPPVIEARPALSKVKLRVSLQRATINEPGAITIGGSQSWTVPLYDRDARPRSPLWYQDKDAKENADLSNYGLRVPRWNDIVKIRLPPTETVSDIQLVDHSSFFPNIPRLGEKVHIVGYPFGYSAGGDEQPTPVVLSRNIASTRVGNSSFRCLLDGPGTEGMSGGPIFMEYSGKLVLLGLYTGVIFPDYKRHTNEKVTALGVCSLVSHCRLCPLEPYPPSANR